MKSNNKSSSQAKSLTSKQERFAAEYLIDLNATAAAERAGYSKKSCQSLGYQLLQNPLVRIEIDRRKKVRNETVHMNADRLLAQMVELAYADVGGMFDGNGSPKPVGDWPLILRTGLITHFDIEEKFEAAGDGERRVSGRRIKIKTIDRTRIFELIGEHTAIRAFRNDVKVDMVNPLEEWRKRVSGNRIQPKPESGLPQKL